MSPETQVSGSVEAEPHPIWSSTTKMSPETQVSGSVEASSDLADETTFE